MLESRSPELAKKATHEKKVVPRPQSLARNNLLALNWEKPLSSLIVGGQPLPGIGELPEDKNQTLGQFVSGGAFPLFTDLRDAIRSGEMRGVRMVVDRYRKLCPSPEELLERNPDLVNWVPWEAFIAYGDWVKSRKEDVDQKISNVASGDVFLKEIQAAFPEGYPRKRTDIVLERQNKDPKSQGVLEAVSNSIDALSDREKIGQFGLGVKQVFSWLEPGKGEVSVVTKKDGQTLVMHARKGYDEQVYIKFSKPDEEELAYFPEHARGTMLMLRDIDVDPQKRDAMVTQVHDRFRYVPETDIVVNGEKVNGHADVKVVGRDEPITPKGQIDVTIHGNSIVVKDNGSGMDQETLFRMFLPGHGKGYTPISPTEAVTIAKEQAEVLLINEEHPRIVFSRNRESDFAISLPENRVNTSSRTIALELGRILKVSEGRDGFEIDENFAVALGVLTEKVLADGSLSDAEKTAFLNSVTLGVDQLSGMNGDGQQDKTAAIVRKTKSGIKAVAVPYIKQLKEQGTTLLPNYAQYERIDTAAQFVDPYLLSGIAEIPKLLEQEGFEKLGADEGIITKDGWRVLAADLKGTEAAEEALAGVRSRDGLLRVKENLEANLPVIIDKDHRIVVVDKDVWERMDDEEDPIRKAYLQESLQALLNQKVYTSYEAEDPRTISVVDRPERPETESAAVKALTEKEKLKLTGENETVFWSRGDTVYYLDESGILQAYDTKEQKVTSARLLEEMEGRQPYAVTVVDDGVWLATFPGRVMFINNDGQVVESYNVHDGFVSTPFTITRDGRLIGDGADGLEIFDPKEQNSDLIQLHVDIQNAKQRGISQVFEGRGGSFILKPPRKETLYIVNPNWPDTYLETNEGTIPRDKEQHHIDVVSRDDQEILISITKDSIELFGLTEDTHWGEINSERIAHFAVSAIGDISATASSIDPKSGDITIHSGRRAFILKKTDSSYEFAAEVKVENKRLDETATVLAGLKKLFGDEGVSYDAAVIALRDRLGGVLTQGSGEVKKAEEKKSESKLTPEQARQAIEEHRQVVSRFIQKNGKPIAEGFNSDWLTRDGLEKVFANYPHILESTRRFMDAVGIDMYRDEFTYVPIDYLVKSYADLNGYLLKNPNHAEWDQLLRGVDTIQMLVSAKKAHYLASEEKKHYSAEEIDEIMAKYRERIAEAKNDNYVGIGDVLLSFYRGKLKNLSRQELAKMLDPDIDGTIDIDVEAVIKFMDLVGIDEYKDEYGQLDDGLLLGTTEGLKDLISVYDQDPASAVPREKIVRNFYEAKKAHDDRIAAEERAKQQSGERRKLSEQEITEALGEHRQWAVAYKNKVGTELLRRFKSMGLKGLKRTDIEDFMSEHPDYDLNHVLKLYDAIGIDEYEDVFANYDDNILKASPEELRTTYSRAWKNVPDFTAGLTTLFAAKLRYNERIAAGERAKQQSGKEWQYSPEEIDENLDWLKLIHQDANGDYRQRVLNLYREEGLTALTRQAITEFIDTHPEQQKLVKSILKELQKFMDIAGVDEYANVFGEVAVFNANLLFRNSDELTTYISRFRDDNPEIVGAIVKLRNEKRKHEQRLQREQGENRIEQQYSEREIRTIIQWYKNDVAATKNQGKNYSEEVLQKYRSYGLTELKREQIERVMRKNPDNSETGTLGMLYALMEVAQVDTYSHAFEDAKPEDYTLTPEQLRKKADDYIQKYESADQYWYALKRLAEEKGYYRERIQQEQGGETEQDKERRIEDAIATYRMRLKKLNFANVLRIPHEEPITRNIIQSAIESPSNDEQRNHAAELRELLEFMNAVELDYYSDSFTRVTNSDFKYTPDRLANTITELKAARLNAEELLEVV